MSVALRLIEDQPAERADLQRVLEAAPGYALAVSGSAFQSPRAAEDLLAACPPGIPSDRKYVWGIWSEGKLIGVIDLIRGFPRSGVAMLGLLLLREDQQKAGAGSLAFRQMEAIVKGWPEIDTLRIGVVRTNGLVLPFWQKMGFRETGELRPYENGACRSETVVLEKSLR